LIFRKLDIDNYLIDKKSSKEKTLIGLQESAALGNRKVTIIIADDHKIFRQGIRALLEYESHFEVIAEAANGEDALKLIQCQTPDILVTDLCMPIIGGIELLKIIKELKLLVRSVVLTLCRESPYVTSAIKVGALGYVLKESGVEHLVPAIHAAMAGQLYLSPPLAQCFIPTSVNKLGLKAPMTDYPISNSQQ